VTAPDDQAALDAELAREIIASARDYAIFVLDPKGRVASWNAGAQRIKGYTAAEILGSHFSRFYPPEAIAAGVCDRELVEAVRDGRFEDEGWRLRKDGSRFWANVVITPLYRGNDHIGFSKITRDLTERKRAEEDRLALVQAEEAVRLRDEFLSIAAHELRTPLMALQLQVESVRTSATALDERQARRLHRASHNVARLADLIAMLMDVTRISTGRLQVTCKPSDLSAIVEDAVDRLQESATDAGCEVIASVERGIVAPVDSMRIGQVVNNLLTNAFRHAPGTKVDLALFENGSCAVLRVADRGPGIPEEQLPNIFERFQRGGASANRGGMGLGLYVAREVVLAHDGQIRASQRSGGGAVLEVRIPIRQT
jgi:PAS domain S-box-containing protein